MAMLDESTKHGCCKRLSKTPRFAWAARGAGVTGGKGRKSARGQHSECGFESLVRTAGAMSLPDVSE
jgi:hypothetical protein